MNDELEAQKLQTMEEDFQDYYVYKVLHLDINKLSEPAFLHQVPLESHVQGLVSLVMHQVELCEPSALGVLHTSFYLCWVKMKCNL